MILQALSLSLPKITKLTSDSPGSHCQSHHNTLSLSRDSPGSLCQSHQNPFSPVTLQALLPKSPNFSQNKIPNLTCNATHCVAAQSLTLIFSRSPLLSGTPSPISTTYLIQHWVHRYSNLPVPCGICLRYVHASHKPASAIRLPNP